MVSLSEIYELIDKECGVNFDQLKPDSDLYADLGIDGDDFSELMEAFAERFSVDMSNYRWYFHHGEEGSLNLGGVFFPPPYRRVKRIPITPELLLSCANSRLWSLSYPNHELPSRRMDLLFNLILIIVFLLAGIFFVGWQWFFGAKIACP